MSQSSIIIAFLVIGYIVFLISSGNIAAFKGLYTS